MPLRGDDAGLPRLVAGSMQTPAEEGKAGETRLWDRGDALGTFGEVLDDGEELSGCEVVWWLRILILETGPGVDTVDPPTLSWLDCVD